MSDNKTDDQLFADWLASPPLAEDVKLSDPVNLPQNGVLGPANTMIGPSDGQPNWGGIYEDALYQGFTNVTTRIECEPLRTTVRDYLDEKGLEYTTGAYVEHRVQDGNDEIQFQVTILNISKKMMAEVVGPALVDFSRKEHVSIELVMTEGDDRSNSCVVVRFKQ